MSCERAHLTLHKSFKKAMVTKLNLNNNRSQYLLDPKRAIQQVENIRDSLIGYCQLNFVVGSGKMCQGRADTNSL